MRTLSALRGTVADSHYDLMIGTKQDYTGHICLLADNTRGLVWYHYCLRHGCLVYKSSKWAYGFSISRWLLV
jgi:hypothetical protein